MANQADGAAQDVDPAEARCTLPSHSQAFNVHMQLACAKVPFGLSYLSSFYTGDRLTQLIAMVQALSYRLALRPGFFKLTILKAAIKRPYYDAWAEIVPDSVLAVWQLPTI